MSADEFMKKVENVKFEDLLQRYSQLNLDVMPFDDFFPDGADEFELGYNAQDMSLDKDEMNESKKPKLTSLIFGYYG